MSATPRRSSRRIRSWRPPLGRLLGLVAVILLAASCEASARVQIDVARDGSGVVTVFLALDPEAARSTVSFERFVPLDDLVATGWELTGPSGQPDGSVTFEASKPFSQPDQLQDILDEVAGEGGPLQDFELTRGQGFAQETFTLNGTVDLRDGLATLSDPELSQAFAGRPLGRPQADLDAANDGEPLESAVSVTLAATLPGSLGSHNGTVEKIPSSLSSTTTAPAGDAGSPTTAPATTAATTTAGADGAFGDPDAGLTDGVVWTPSFSDASPLNVRAESSESSLVPRLWRWFAIGALVLGLSLLAYQVGFGVLERRREHRRFRRRQARRPARRLTVNEPAPDVDGVGAVRPAEGPQRDGTPAPASENGAADAAGPAQAAVPAATGGSLAEGQQARPAGGMRLLVVQTAGVMFDVTDPVEELLVPYLRSRSSELPVSQVRDWYAARTVGRLPAQDFWIGLGLSGEPVLADDAYARRYELSEDVVEFLNEARRRGFQIAAVGEEAAEWISVFRQRFELDDVIGTWVTAADVGAQMPSPRYLDAVRRATAVPAQATMVISANVEFLDLARARGSRTVRYAHHSDDLSGDHALLRSFKRVEA